MPAWRLQPQDKNVKGSPLLVLVGPLFWRFGSLLLKGITDGSYNPLNALSELYILQETAGRWAFGMGVDLHGEDVCPTDMFDIIGGTGIGG